jgi:hypothetical protein
MLNIFINMKRIVLTLFLVLFILGTFYCSDNPKYVLDNKAAKIIIQSKLPFPYEQELSINPSFKDGTQIQWATMDYIGINPVWESKKQELSSRKWVLYSEKPILLNTPFLHNRIIITPGDSICVDYNGGRLNFSGNGSEKLKFQEEIEQIQRNALIKPTKSYLHIKSINDYYKWKVYLDKQLELMLITLDFYRDKVSSLVYESTKINAIYGIELQRAESFMALCNIRNNGSIVKKSDLISICDSTLSRSWAKWLQLRSDYQGGVWYYFQYNRIQVWRKFGFDIDNDSMNTDGKRRLIYYNALKQNYQGRLRERLLQYMVAYETIKELGLNNQVTEMILKDYYNQPGFPEYKDWMKKYQNEISRKQDLAKKVN